jgi:hypothetical protein
MSEPDPPPELPPRKAPEPFAVRFPESRGPGVEVASGGVAYGDVTTPQVTMVMPRSAAERDHDMALYRDGCARCQEIPSEVVGAIVAALRAAKEGRSA